MYYDYFYRIQHGDTLSKIAKKFGFENPGPITYYERNNKIRNWQIIYIGQYIYIPWTEASLNKHKKRLCSSMEKRFKLFCNSIQKEKDLAKEMAEKIIAIDIVAIVLTMGLSLVMSVNSAFKVMQGIKIASDVTKLTIFLTLFKKIYDAQSIYSSASLANIGYRELNQKEGSKKSIILYENALKKYNPKYLDSYKKIKNFTNEKKDNYGWDLVLGFFSPSTWVRSVESHGMTLKDWFVRRLKFHLLDYEADFGSRSFEYLCVNEQLMSKCYRKTDNKRYIHEQALYGTLLI